VSVLLCIVVYWCVLAWVLVCLVCIGVCVCVCVVSVCVCVGVCSAFCRSFNQCHPSFVFSPGTNIK